MAKSFATPPPPTPARPLADRDFFDLTADPPPTSPVPAPPTASTPEEVAVSLSPTGNTGNEVLLGKLGNEAQPDNGSNTPQPVLPITPLTISVASPANPALPGKHKQPRQPPHPGKTEKPGNTGLPAVTGWPTATGITDLPASLAPVADPATSLPGAAYPPGDVRQTFVLSRAHLEQLLDFVHTRRAAGDYLYTQKQALQQALDLLFASQPGRILPRPTALRELEQERRTRI